MSEKQQDCFAGVGTLTRGLELLRLINEMHPAHVCELERVTGVPKATVSRLLKTLRSTGYVVQDPGTLTYSPAAKARELSSGITADEWILDVAAPALDRLSKRVQWPSDFAVLEGRGMTIRYTTRRTAPIPTVDPINVSGLAMLESDFGRAFLGFASETQRCLILRALYRSSRSLDLPVHDDAEIKQLLAQIVKQGYARRGAAYAFTRASTIAVAVVVEGQAVGAFNIICNTQVIPPAEIADRYLAELQFTAAEIAAGLKTTGPLVARADGLGRVEEMNDQLVRSSEQRRQRQCF